MKASRRVKLSDVVSVHPSSSSSRSSSTSSPPTTTSTSSPSLPSPSQSPPPSPPSSLSELPSSTTSKPPLLLSASSTPPPSALPQTASPPSSSSSDPKQQPLLPTASPLSRSVSSLRGSKPDRRRRISFSAESLLIAAIQDGDIDDLLKVLRCRPLDSDITSTSTTTTTTCTSISSSTATSEYDKATEQLVNQTNHTGLTPLHHGVLTNNLDAVKILLTCGADVNAQDENGFSPLHTASACGSVHAVSLLILFGADVFLLTKESETAVDVSRDIQVIRLLSQEMYSKIHSDIFVSAWLLQKLTEGCRVVMCYLRKSCRYLYKAYLRYVTDGSGRRTKMN